MRWGIYPLTMILTTVAFVYGLAWEGLSLEMATTFPILGAIVVLLLAEWQLPYKKQWQPRWQDVKNDGTYLLLVQTLLPRFFSWLLLIVLLGRLSEGNRIGLGWWPSQAPLLLQALLVTLLSDLLRYWLHRWNHTLPFLWRFHAVHHSVDKLYWLNTSRFHPFEKLLQFLMDVTPFVLLGGTGRCLSPTPHMVRGQWLLPTFQHRFTLWLVELYREQHRFTPLAPCPRSQRFKPQLWQ